jgi:transcription initiation factor TFIID TATA-box-binding protein
MSQEDIRQLLLDAGNEATIRELSELARQKFPKRSLHQYIQDRMSSMEKKGLVEPTKDGTAWRLTDRGRDEPTSYPLNELDAIIDTEELVDEGISIANLVGSTHIGRAIDLSEISHDLPNTEYHPETSPNLIYRPEGDNNVCIMVPSSGHISITGAKSGEELLVAVRRFVSELEKLGLDIKIADEEILIQNVVANYDFGREFDLSVLAISLGLDNVEYEPEQFPGLVYRSRSGYCTALLFNSGKLVITGASTYLQVIKTIDELKEDLADIGVDLQKSTAR